MTKCKLSVPDGDNALVRCSFMLIAGDLQFSYVKQEDASPNLRYQCGAISPVLQDGLRLGDEVRVVAKSLPSKHFNNGFSV